MATDTQPARTTRQLMRRERRMSPALVDPEKMKNIRATHSPDGSDLEVKLILDAIQTILQHVCPGIDGVVNGMHSEESASSEEDDAALSGRDGILDILANITHEISCEVTCKCSGGGDAHAMTMEILKTLSRYPWDAKVVLSLAAFAVKYGEFRQSTNPLAKLASFLKQQPHIQEHSNALRSLFDAIKNLIKAMLNVTKCIVEFKGLPPQYMPDDISAIVQIPAVVYWTIRSTVFCSSRINTLLGMKLNGSTGETWELSFLTSTLTSIHNDLQAQLANCYQHMGKRKSVEYFERLVHLLKIPQPDNMKILEALIYIKDDLLPLEVGTTKTRVNVKVLREKTVVLLISDLDLSSDELQILTHIYQEKRTRPELQYEIVWLPVVNRSVPWNEAHEQKFRQLQSQMPWYTLHHPSLLEPAVNRYIKEMWHFKNKMKLVVLDQRGKVVCPDGLHMFWIWGNIAYPFTLMVEEELWNEKTWSLELLVDGIDPLIVEWIDYERYICLCGGEDIEWIRKFTATATKVAKAAGIPLEMAYVGKNRSSKERVRRINSVISKENLSHYLDEATKVWNFWTRVERMLFSKMQLGKTIADDKIMQEVQTILGFDGCDQGWALFGSGSAEMARAKGDKMMMSLTDFPSWKLQAREEYFVQVLNEQLQSLQTPHHCNRLILPGIAGDAIPELVVCADCGRPMEKLLIYSCCID